MRFSSLLPLAGLAAGFVIPDPEILSTAAQRAGSDHPEAGHSLENPLDAILDRTRNVVDYAQSYIEHCVDRLTGDDDGELDSIDSKSTPLNDDGSSHNTPIPAKHHEKSNLTIYQLISESKYTTKLAALVSEDEDLVKVLNGTKANYTLFAPTDKAFEKIPDHGHKPSKEFIKSLLLLHISGDFYPATRVLKSHTIPTLLKEEKLGGFQRLTVKLGLKGLTVNYFSRVVAINIFGSNGVIHALDTILIIPLPTLPIVEATPSVFSTLALGLTKTNLLKHLKEIPHIGGTLFAPSNNAFAKLGPKVNAFLFSKYGNKYLKALLQYHVVFNATLYSDAYYHTDEASYASLPIVNAEDDAESVAKGHDGHYHLDLPTQLEDRSLSVDIARWGPFTTIRVNGYVDVTYSDTVARDGVIQIVGDVLIPPKKLSNAEGVVTDFNYWDGVTELTEEDLVERLEPYVVDGDDVHEIDEYLLEDTWSTNEHELEAEKIGNHFSEWKDSL